MTGPPVRERVRDHRVDPLQLAQRPLGLGVICQLVGGEDPAWDVSAHRFLLTEGDVGDVDGDRGRVQDRVPVGVSEVDPVPWFAVAAV